MDWRVRRAGLSGAVVTALPAVVAVVSYGARADLPWWAVVAVALLTAGLAGWTGAQIGRRRGIRNEVLEPGEKMLGTYTVRPPTPNTPRPQPMRARSTNSA